MVGRDMTFDEALSECYAIGDSRQVEDFLLQRADTAEDPMETIAALTELGAFYRSSGLCPNSIEIFHRAIELCKKEKGEDSPLLAAMLNNAAGTYRQMRDYDKAAEAFKKAADIYRRLGGDYSGQCASVLSNLSLMYRELNSINLAVTYLEEALALIETIPNNHREAALTYNNLTELYFASGDKNEAMFCLDRALQELEMCSGEEWSHFSDVLNSLAAFLYSQGDYRRALSLYHRSAGYIKQYYGENVDYGITCQNMRWAYEKLGDDKGAIAALTKAAGIYEKALGLQHERTRSVMEDLDRLKRA